MDPTSVLGQTLLDSRMNNGTIGADNPIAKIRSLVGNLFGGDFSGAGDAASSLVPDSVKEGGQAFLRGSVGNPWAINNDQDKRGVGGLTGALYTAGTNPGALVSGIMGQPGREKAIDALVDSIMQAKQGNVGGALSSGAATLGHTLGSVPLVGSPLESIYSETQPNYPNEPLLNRISRGIGGVAGIGAMGKFFKGPDEGKLWLDEHDARPPIESDLYGRNTKLADLEKIANRPEPYEIPPTPKFQAYLDSLKPVDASEGTSPNLDFTESTPKSLADIIKEMQTRDGSGQTPALPSEDFSGAGNQDPITQSIDNSLKNPPTPGTGPVPRLDFSDPTFIQMLLDKLKGKK